MDERIIESFHFVSVRYHQNHRGSESTAAALVDETFFKSRRRTNLRVSSQIVSEEAVESLWTKR